MEWAGFWIGLGIWLALGDLGDGIKDCGNEIRRGLEKLADAIRENDDADSGEEGGA